MKEDLVTQFYFISNVTGSYLQSTITEMSNEALVFSFTALIVMVFLVYFLQMRRGTSKGLKKLKRLRETLELAIGTTSINTSQERDEVQLKLRATKDDTAFLRSVERSGMLYFWSQINQSFTYEANGKKVYITVDFINSFLNFENFITA